MALHVVLYDPSTFHFWMDESKLISKSSSFMTSVSQDPRDKYDDRIQNTTILSVLGEPI